MVSHHSQRSHAAIFLNGFYDGRYPAFYQAVCADTTLFRVCADGALSAWAWLNRTFGTAYAPDWVVGDFDSFDAGQRREWEARGTHFDLTWSGKTDKDYTDGQLALHAALKVGCRNFAFYGALPSPNAYDYDHFLGNLFLLAEARAQAGDDPTSAARLADPLQAIYLCTRALTLYREGAGLNRVSLLPFTGPASVRIGSGLRWSLQDFSLRTDTANALRNEFLPDADRVTLELEPDSGPVVVVHNWV